MNLFCVTFTKVTKLLHLNSQSHHLSAYPLPSSFIAVSSLVPCVFYPSAFFSFSQIARQNLAIERERLQRESDHRCMLKEEAEACSKLELPPGSKTSISPTNSSLTQNKNAQALVQQYAKARKERVDVFLAHVYNKRTDYVKSLLSKHPVILTNPPETLIAL